MTHLRFGTSRVSRLVVLGLLLSGSIMLCGNGCPVATKPIEPAPGRGTIRVDPQPPDIQAPWQMARQDLREDSWEGVGSDTLRSMRQGKYILYWGDVEGYEIYALEFESSILYDDETITFEVLYEPPRKDIVIEVDPPELNLNATWVLEIPFDDDYAGHGYRVLSEMAPGEYTIRWADVSGYVAPPSASATHGYESDLVFVGVYVPE